MNFVNKVLAMFIICLILPFSAIACPDTPNGITSTGNVTINDFTVNNVNGTAPLSTEFTANITGNATRWCWIFGNKSQQPNDWYSLHSKTAKHTFVNPGKYTVTLEVWDATGKMASMTKENYITVNQKPIKPFSKKMDFKVTGKCIEQVTYIFGDGTQLTTKCLKATHIYTSKGTFKTKINVVYTNGNCKQITKTIKIC